MEFFVCDSIETYNKRFEFNGVDITRLFIEDIYIPENGAFWFKSDYKLNENNVNLNKKYLHIHAGLTQFENMQFDKKPHIVRRTEIMYNPKDKCIEVNIPKKLFGTRNIFKKHALYLGAELPKRKITVVGEVIYNMATETIYFILNYFPQGTMKFHWEEEPEPPTVEQIMRVQILEEEIAEKEKLLPSHFETLSSRP